MNRKSIRLLLPLLLSLLALCLFVLLCSPSLNVAHSAGQTQIVDIVAAFDESEIAAVLDEFTARTGISTTFTYVENLSETLLECLGPIVCPDVALIPNPSLLGPLADQGAIQPVESLIPDFDDNYAPGWRQIGSVGGTLYAAPFAASHKSMIWYRPDAFSAIGASEPSNWEELLNLADQLVADGQTPFSIGAESGAASGWPLSDIFENILIRVGGPETHRRLARHDIPWTDPLVVQTMERFSDIVGPNEYQVGGITGTLTTHFIDAVQPVFGPSPEAAMYFGASFTQFFLDPGLTPFVDFDFFDFPEIRGQFDRPLIGGADLVTMFNSAAETTALVEFLASADAGDVLVSNVAGRISPNKNVDLNAYLSEIDRAAAELLVDADDYLFDLDDQLPHELQSVIWSSLMDFVTHQDEKMAILQGIEDQATAFQGPSAVSGALAVGIGAGVSGLDPARLADSNSWMVTDQIYDTLIDFMSDGFRPYPGLAESWSVSPDGITWTFNIRPGVQFHDGTALDAAAVDYNFQRWWDPAHPFHTGDFVVFEYLLGGYKGSPGSLISATNTIGSDQFQLILSRSNSQLPAMLMHPALAIASPAAIQSGNLITEPVGTGPFAFAESIPDDHITLAANTDYWGTGPLLDALTFQIIPDPGDRYAALEADLIQVASQLSSSYATVAGANPDLSVYWHPPLNTGYLGINRAHGPLGDPQVRQAIAHAIDKQALVDLVYTEGDLVAKDLLPPDVWGSDPAIVDYDYNPLLSQQLLTDAGYPNGFATTLALRDVYRQYIPEPVLTASTIQAMLQAVGIDAEVVVYESGEFIDLAFSGQLDLFLLGWIADYPHPANFYDVHFCDFYLAYGPRDDTLCDLLEAAALETQFVEQLALYQQASNRIHDTLPLVPLAHGQDPLITRSNVTGIRFTPFNGVDFAGVGYLSDGSIQGDVILQGRFDHSDVLVDAWADGGIVDTFTTGAGGSYTLTVPGATYTVTYEMARYLDTGFVGVSVTPGMTTSLPDVTLRCGDCNDDDIVNILDLALMGGHYTLTCADAGWDERADINNDCVVNILDLSCAGGNYLEVSTTP